MSTCIIPIPSLSPSFKLGAGEKNVRFLIQQFPLEAVILRMVNAPPSESVAVPYQTPFFLDLIRVLGLRLDLINILGLWGYIMGVNPEGQRIRLFLVGSSLDLEAG